METTKFINGLLVNGDGLEYMKTMPDHSVDMILTDPPYEYASIKPKIREITKEMSDADRSIAKLQNQMADIVSGYDYKGFWNEWMRLMKQPNLAIYCNSEQLPIYMGLAKENGLSYKVLILKKKNPAPYDMPYANDTEFCLYIYDQKKPFKNYSNDKTPTVYEYLIGNSRKDDYGNRDNVSWHPTTKPLGHAMQLLEKHTQKGDVVLDCFSGSGTTAMACARLKRNFVAIELNNTYYTKSIERIKGAESIQAFDFGEDE